MGSTTTGGAVHNGANGFDDISKLLAGVKADIRKDTKTHNDRMEEYHKGTIEVLKESTSSLRSSIEDSHKKTVEVIKVDGEETRKLVADTHAKAMEVITAGHRATSDKLDTLVHRTKTTVGDIFLTLVLATAGFFGGWNIAAANTTLFWNKLAFGGLGFLGVGAAAILIISVIRGLYEKRSDAFQVQETRSKVKPEAKSEVEPPEAPKPAKKAEPAADPKPEATEVDDKKSSGAN